MIVTYRISTLRLQIGLAQNCDHSTSLLRIYICYSYKIRTLLRKNLTKRGRFFSY